MDHHEAFRAAALAQGTTPAELDAWLAETRFCVELNTTGDGPVAAHIGGAPTMPADVPWPQNPDGAALEFLAAVDCAALPRDAGTDVLLPAQGHLLFFLSYDDDTEYEQDNTRILHVPAGGQERPGDDPYERVDLYPSVRFSRDDSDGDTDPDDPLTDLARKFWREADQPGPDRMRIGGHGDVAHNSPESTVLDLLTSQGAQPTTEGWEAWNEAHDQIVRDWVPLAQFGHPNNHWDGVNARFMIRRTDLSESRFDRVISSAEFGG
ncbi:DUF1963 domain-containing protein [Actinoplanes sp. NPDC049265]|uniref:DUF1963 domain-containing protein n=1 Tax=Actinoplanes sp. NPDC049265 TaxID=3363902 RepID=UPI0037150F1A